MTDRRRMEPQPPKNTTPAWRRVGRGRDWHFTSGTPCKTCGVETVTVEMSCDPPPDMPNARPVQDDDGVWWWVEEDES